MRLTVVSEGESRCIQVPVAWMMIEVPLDRRFKCSFIPFDLSIRLRMVCCSELVRHVQYVTDILEKLASETLAVVGEKLFRDP